ncbi:MAG: T9SS type A sorting domain-containing protein [Flavobacteriales bacterium]
MRTSMQFLNSVLVTFLLTVWALQIDAQGVLKVPEQYANISQAVAGAHEGDTILIAQGTYQGTGFRLIEIDKSLTIAGEYLYTKNLPDAARTIIDCGGTNKEAFTVTGGSGVCAKFIGLSITGFIGEEFDRGAIRIIGSNAIFQSCLFLDNSAVAYPAWGFEGTAISIKDSSQVKFYNCLFADNIGAAIGVNDTKLHHPDGKQGLPPRIYVTACTFANNTDCGIALNDSGNETVPELFVSNSMFISNGNYGISGEYEGKSPNHVYQVRNCLFYGNSSGRVNGYYFEPEIFKTIDTNSLGINLDSFGNFTTIPNFKPDSLADYPYQYAYNSPNVNTGSTDTFDVDNSITDIGFGNIKKFFDLECDYESLIASIENARSGTSESIRIYPNPSSDHVFIDGISKGQHQSLVNIRTISGQLVMEMNYAPEGIDVQHLKPGIYLITVTSNDRIRTQRLVIQH